MNTANFVVMAIEQYIGLNTVSLRKKLGMKQEELCERMGISQPQLSRIENGKSKIGLGMLERLAEALQTTPIELIQNPDMQNRSLAEKIEAIQKLPKKKRQSLMEIIDTMLQQEQGSK